jgi:hypothetical protein
MNHWQMIAIAYGLTFVALAAEVLLLRRRRLAALRQVRESLADADHDAAGGAGAGAVS